MKLPSTLYLKWIDASAPTAKDIDYLLFNECVLASSGEKKSFTGFTVFQPRDFNEGLITRLKVRLDKAKDLNQKFTLFAPEFIKHRIESLFTKHNVNLSTIIYTPFTNITFSAGQFHIRSRLRVVNVDDSPVLLKFLKHTLGELGFVDVVGQCSESVKAAQLIHTLNPDVVTMDIQMPNKSGVEVVREVLARKHYPIIMISSLSFEDGTQIFDALNSGAFDYIQKPNIDQKKSFAEDITAKLLSAVEGRDAHSALRELENKPKSTTRIQSTAALPPNLLWVLGASTGGTQALTRVFTSLPNQIPPILVVQHIPPIYSKAFAESVAALCPYEVTEAKNGEPILPNHIYIAPGGTQMGVEQKYGKLSIVITDAPPVNRFKPSVDYMFNEVAKIKGHNIVAAVMTGMGRDGAHGLLALKKIGAKTFVQDEKTSTVYGMPRAAFELGATDLRVPLDSIAHTLLEKSVSTATKVA